MTRRRQYSVCSLWYPLAILTILWTGIWAEETKKSDTGIDSDNESNIPMWHLQMIQDTARNEAFYNALKEVIVPKVSTVLDLGSGTGLLSMYAAVLGAKKVTSVEVEHELAILSQNIVQFNYFSHNQINIINVHSSELTIGSHGYDEPATILVSETMDAWIVGEGYLDTLVDIRRRGLIQPDAVVIPNSAKLYVQLVQTTYLFPTEIPNISGLDFSVMAKSFHFKDVTIEHLNNVVSRYLSDPHHILSFNFQEFGNTMEREYPTTYQSLVIPVTKSGMMHGASFWFDLCVDPNCRITLNNSVNSTSYSWRQATHLFSFSGKKVSAGSSIQLLIAHRSERYIIGLADEGQRIVRISNYCPYFVAIFQVDKPESYTEMLRFEGAQEMNLMLGQAGLTYIAVAYDYGRCQSDDISNSCQPIMQEVHRFVIPVYIGEDIPLYREEINCLGMNSQSS